MLYFRWFDEDSWRVLKPVFFGSLPFGVRDAVAWAMRRKVRATLRAQGLGVHGRDELLAFARDDLDALDGLLGQVPYYGGEHPCSADAAAYGILANLIEATLDTPLSHVARGYPRLVAYCERMRERVWVSEATAATAAIGKCWSVYLVRAENGALYCGISDDPLRRFDTHCSGKGARFFHSSPARALVYVEACASKGDALRRERAIKALSKRAKERLLVGVPVLREVGEPAI